MSGDSLFSFIKRSAEPEKPAQRAPAPPPPPHTPAPAQHAPAPPPPSTVNYDKLAARIAELEAKVKSLEASGEKISALEQASAGLFAGLQKTDGDVDRVMQQLPKLVGELTVIRSRLDGLEETCRGLSMSGSESKRYIKDLEASVLGEIKERFAAFDIAFGEILRKASLAHDTAAAGAKRLDKVEERSLRLSHIENRLENDEKKLETIYEVDASVQALKSAMESIEGRIASLMKESACLAGEQKRELSDLEALSHQVRQLSALFNYFRTELSFLLPKKKENVGEER